MALRRPGVRIPLGPLQEALARVLFCCLYGIEKALPARGGCARFESPWVHCKKHSRGCFFAAHMALRRPCPQEGAAHGVLVSSRLDPLLPLQEGSQLCKLVKNQQPSLKILSSRFKRLQSPGSSSWASRRESNNPPRGKLTQFVCFERPHPIQCH